jgi:hypothetical protein
MSSERMDTQLQTESPEQDWQYHERTYKWFVRGTLLFAAHALVILLILGYIFSDNMG